MTRVVLCGALLAACGGSGDDDYKVMPPPSSVDSGTPVDAATPPRDTASTVDGVVVDGAPIGGADLSIAISAAPQPVDLSSPLTYTIDVVNLSTSSEDATGVTVTQRLPPGDVAFVSATGIDWTCTHEGQNVICKRATLHPGPAPSISVKVTTPPVSGSLTTTVDVSSTSGDPVLTNNDAAAATSVLAPDLATADLSITIADSPDPVQGSTSPGCGTTDCVVYTMGVHNAGPDVATQLEVSITLPAQGTFFNVVGTGWVCPAPNAGKILCTRPNLAAAADSIITLTWKAPSPGGFSIQVAPTVRGSSTDNNPTNDSDSEDTTVKP